jgi:hypothetical protein
MRSIAANVLPDARPHARFLPFPADFAEKGDFASGVYLAKMDWLKRPRGFRPMVIALPN